MAQVAKYSSRANGYARGEGIAAVVLKTLGAAIADGDNIECVIVETGLNQDGKTKGLTVPSAAAQTKLIETTYRKAGLDLTNPSHRPQFFEAHGTGTPAGDPVEAQAIHEAFFGTKNTEASHNGEPLYCGSVKTVIGHTEGTAGLAGLIKTSLALQHNIIPPNCLFKDLAPSVRPFYKNLEIVTEPRPWPTLAPGSVRRASVNSFVCQQSFQLKCALTLHRDLEELMLIVSWRATLQSGLRKLKLLSCLCHFSSQRPRKNLYCPCSLRIHNTSRHHPRSTLRPYPIHCPPKGPRIHCGWL